MNKCDYCIYSVENVVCSHGDNISYIFENNSSFYVLTCNEMNRNNMCELYEARDKSIKKININIKGV